MFTTSLLLLLVACAVRGGTATLIAAAAEKLPAAYLSAQVRRGIWLAVMLLFVLWMPFFQLRLPSNGIATPAAVAPASTQSLEVVPASTLSPVPALAEKPGSAIAVPALPTAAPWWKNITLTETLLTLWLVGMAAMGLRFVLGWRLLARRIDRLPEVADARVLAIFEQCRNEIRHSLGRSAEKALDRVRLKAGTQGPLLFGWRHPVIVLPMAASTRLNDAQLRFILLHELCHLVHHDVQWNLPACLILCFQWFNPFCYYAHRKFRSALETWCDHRVLQLTGRDQQDGYGNTLIKMLELRHRGAILPGVGIAEDKKELTRRITMIHFFQRQKVFGVIAAAATVAVGLAIVGGCGIGTARTATVAAPPPDDTLTPAQIMAKMEQTYAACRTYSDRGLVKQDYFNLDGTKTQTRELPFTTVFVRPDRFRFEFQNPARKTDECYIVWQNGQEIKVWWDVQPVIQKETSLAQALAGATGVSGGSAHTVPAMLLPKTAGTTWLRRLTQLKRLPDAKIENTVCYRIQGGLKSRDTILWIDHTRFLLLKLEETKQFRNFRTEDVTTYAPRLDEPLSDAQLAFQLPPRANGKPEVVNKGFSQQKNQTFSRIYKLLEQGRALSAEQAAQLEKQLTGTAKDLPVLTQLQGYYSEYYLTNPILRQKRNELMIQMVKNYPEAEVFGTGAVMLIDSKDDIGPIKKLWQEHLQKHPDDVNLLRNAAKNLLVADTDFAIACFTRCRKLEPNNPEWILALAHTEQLKGIKAKRQPKPTAPVRQ